MTNGCGIVRADNGQAFQFDQRGVAGKTLRREMRVGTRVEFQLYFGKTSRKHVAVCLRYALPAKTRKSLAHLPKAAKPASEVAVPGTERLACKEVRQPIRVIETFLGTLEVLQEGGLDGLAVVRNERGDVMQVSQSIVARPSVRPVIDEEPKSEAEQVSVS